MGEILSHARGAFREKSGSFRELGRGIAEPGKNFKRNILPQGRRVPIEKIRLNPLEEAVLKIAARREREGELLPLRIDEYDIHRTRLDLEANYGMKWDLYRHGTRDILQAVSRLYNLRLLTPRMFGECASLSRMGWRFLGMEETKAAKRA